MKRMRLPNGYGSVTKLKGKRRRPYWVKKTVRFDSRGYPVVETIGYYATYAEGLNALAEYNRNPYDLDAASITFRDGFERWLKEYLMVSSDVSDSTKYTHMHTLELCKSLHERPLRNITSSELQTFLATFSYGTQTALRRTWKIFFKWTTANGITDKNIASFVKLTKSSTPKRNPFTVDEVREIWKMPDTKQKAAILILLYTGMRVGELNTVSEVHEHYLVAGEKTKEGRNRAIPIHPLIQPIVKDFEFNSNSVAYYEKQVEKLLPGHTPHDTRRTFISRSVECGIADVACRKIVGHVGRDIHESMYTFLTPEYLYEEIQKLCY